MWLVPRLAWKLSFGGSVWESEHFKSQGRKLKKSSNPRGIQCHFYCMLLVTRKSLGPRLKGRESRPSPLNGKSYWIICSHFLILPFGHRLFTFLPHAKYSHPKRLSIVTSDSTARSGFLYQVQVWVICLEDNFARNLKACELQRHCIQWWNQS